MSSQPLTKLNPGEMIEEEPSYSEYETRKMMLELLSEQEIKAIIKAKEDECRTFLAPRNLNTVPSFLASLLELKEDFVTSSLREQLLEPQRECIDLLSKELRRRYNANNGSMIDLEELKQSVSIIDVATHYGHTKHMRNGANIRCPFHDDRTASLHLYKNTNTFKCFGCQTGGSVLDYIIHSEKCSIKEAINRLKSFA